LAPGHNTHFHREAECVEVKDIMARMLNHRDQYFSDGYLNSEGVKLLNIAIRWAIEKCPEYVVYFKKLRKSKDYEDLLKIARVLETASQ